MDRHIQKIFLGLDRPGLPAAVEYLQTRYQERESLDLSQVLVVVPGRRAGRRLLELLATEASSRHILMTPPLIETVGRIPEHLYTPRRPFASDLTQRLAWAQVLRKADEATLAPLLPNRPAESSSRWEELAALLRRQHIELAADGLDFPHVANQVESIGGRDEWLRWSALAQLQAAYHQTLDELQLWDRQTARLKAIEYGECVTQRDLILVGTVDMNVALRKMLDQVVERVTALVLAPPDWNGRFDEYGCLVPDAWQEVDAGLRDEQIEVADGPPEQAEAVVRKLASYGTRYHTDDVAIGVPDEQLVAEVERRLARAGVDARWGPGQPLRGSNPFRLLSGVRDFLDNRRFADAANLVRHPDVESWLRSRGIDGDWLTELDRYQTDHLPYGMPDPWLGPAKNSATVRAAFRELADWVARLPERELPLSDWQSTLTDFLLEVYGHREFDRSASEDRLTIRCCSRFVELLDELTAVPASLAPTMSAAEAIGLLLELTATDRMEAEPSEAIELLGWLELPLDDAPAVIVTSFNEGYVPDSINSDLFLPNTLRSKLGLLDNPRRFARDSYALHILVQTRESLHVIVGRRTIDGDPLTPSRLLFTTSRETAARRVKEFFSDLSTPPPSQAAAPIAEQPTDRLPVPQPQPVGDEISELSITSLRDYLACPYRFYLRHVVKVSTLDDHVEELDGGAFGTMAHEVLRRFGEGTCRDSKDATEIKTAVYQELARYVAEQYGKDVMPAVRVQVEQLRLRLAAFATQQASWAAEGWSIEHVESGLGQAVEIEVDDQPVTLRGRIDRIDLHRETGRRVILDYKTSDLAKSPDQTHRRHGKWIDLQLPLYRRLAASLQKATSFELGYVLLPRDTARTGFSLANWTEAQLQEADDLAGATIRSIRREEFWPPADPPPEFSEDLAVICQDHVIHRRQ